MRKNANGQYLTFK